jgi:putative peptidoglycan lipid II flippase
VKRLATTTSDGGTRRSAALVALGILCSRVVGLVRQRVIAHYFGLTTDAADAWAAGIKIPNFLQNLFGEGALSASFIPVYASLLERDRREADRVAGAIAALLVLIVTAIVAAGVLTAPWLLGAIAPGFTGERRDLTIAIVRILFPGVGLLVMSAWCLGVLNSHRRFFLSYAAPVLWNVAMIVTLLWFGPTTAPERLVIVLAWGSVVGSALQFAVQLPTVIRVAPALSLTLRTQSEDVRAVIRNFGPAFLSRGVVQISAYVDTQFASLLPLGAMAALTNAQTLGTLPVSLFGMSISAAQLPDLSRAASGGADAFDGLRARLDSGLRQIAFLVVPSAMAFLAFGDVVAAALLQSGRFSAADALYLWGILAGSAVGLLASTLGRLYSSTYYALRDTRTPLRYAVIRIVLTTVLGYLFAFPLPRWLALDPAWGVAGLTASAGLAGWIEMWLLRRTLNAKIGRTGLSTRLMGTLWLAAVVGAAVGWIAKLALAGDSPLVLAAGVLPVYGIVYLVVAMVARVPEATELTARLRRRLQSKPRA